MSKQQGKPRPSGRRTGADPAYRLAKQRYADLGVDTDEAMAILARTPISLHCWQGDDVGGFERAESGLTDGGLQVTGNYPGRARTPAELRADLDQALALIPGRHRLNLHAFYGDFSSGLVDRNRIDVRHFRSWIDWAGRRGLGLDFNPTFFAHPKVQNGCTLTHPDPAIRKFWVEHGIACRHIGAAMGKALGTPCVTNVWIPDGSKDMPADRRGPRERLRASLDEIFSEDINPAWNLDAVESKLFGIGSESYVAGSLEFYLGYAAANRKLLCLDMGHFHPTESVADKLSAVLMWVDEVLLHVSRGVRWDSDHVVTLTDDLRALAEEVVRGEYLERVHIGLDYFDATINRVAAWVIGARNMQKALLLALLEPRARLRAAESGGDGTARLAWMEESKTLPFGAVWDRFCTVQGVPAGATWLDEVKRYERRVQSRRT